MAYAVAMKNLKTGNIRYLGSLRPWIWHHIPAFHYQTEAAARNDAIAARDRINEGWGDKAACYLIDVIPV